MMASTYSEAEDLASDAASLPCRPAARKWVRPSPTSSYVSSAPLAGTVGSYHW